MRGRKTAANYANKQNYPIITIGTVESTDDAFQLGRIQVRCPAWLDAETPVEDLPFTRLVSPFMGFDTNTPRGVNEDVSDGHVAYGQWTIPKVGSQVVVSLIDNDPAHRVWLGNVAELFLSHTMPHGRYLDDRIPKTSTESPIEPLATNTGEAFNGNRESSEYATRAMDRQVSAYPANEFGDRIVASNEADQVEQTITNPDGSIIERTQGYIDGSSAIHSITTPGFHSMSMDDDPNNCRVRFRTTSGHQIILDDTNERIYVSTAKGKTWIEIDEKGTIDIYGEQDISISSDADLNLHAKEKVRIGAGRGIHMTSGSDIRMHSKEDIHVKADGDIRAHSTNIKIQADADYTMSVVGKHDEKSGSIVVSSESSYDVTVADQYRLKSTGYLMDGDSIKVDKDLFATLNIHANGKISAVGTIGTPAAGIFGNISAASVTASGGISAGGGMSATGSISTDGILSSTADVIAGNVSLRSHLHLVPLPAQAAGTIPSPPPVPSAASLPVIPPTPTPTLDTAVEPMGEPTSSEASTADELPANFVSRIPQHEPYTRSYLKLEETDKDITGETTLGLFGTTTSDVDSISEYAATNPSAGTGSESRGKDFARNAKWRR